MARLVVTSGKHRDEVIELHWGINSIGRGPENHFQFDEPTVSTNHCEIVVEDSGLTVWDKNSTNGTFLDGQRIREARLEVGQTLSLGGLELLVEATDVVVALPTPKAKIPSAPSPSSDAGGIMPCPRHPHFQASYRCTHCHAVLCETCLHHLRRRGSQTLRLCPFCSYKCEPITQRVIQKRSFIARVWDKTRTAMLKQFGRPG